jgi:hypothetical protein
MARTPRRSRALAGLALAVSLCAVVTGCALSALGSLQTNSTHAGTRSLTGDTVSAGVGAGAGATAVVAAPGRLTGRTHTADLVVVGRHTLAAALRRRIHRTEGVLATSTLAMATAPVGGRMVTIGAVDPASYRRFTPELTARADAVWARVAEGDIAISPELADDLGQPLGGELVLGNASGALSLRVGAEASMAPTIDAVVNQVRARQLGMVPANAVLVSTGGAEAFHVAESLRRLVGSRATVSALSETTPAQGQETAFLTGGSVAEAVGSFRYRYFPDGTVEPAPAWVAATIRTEPVPVLGDVTCHRVMLPQLRGALQEVVDLGLAGHIDPGDFGGCYAPRFIAHDPRKGLSLHTWGIAVDLNVQGNLRGTTGEIDRRIVDVFKRWGFAWGGDWSYTDPMHFELAALVRPEG